MRLLPLVLATAALAFVGCSDDPAGLVLVATPEWVVGELPLEVNGGVIEFASGSGRTVASALVSEGGVMDEVRMIEYRNGQWALLGDRGLPRTGEGSAPRDVAVTDFGLVFVVGGNYSTVPPRAVVWFESGSGWGFAEGKAGSGVLYAAEAVGGELAVAMGGNAFSTPGFKAPLLELSSTSVSFGTVPLAPGTGGIHIFDLARAGSDLFSLGWIAMVEGDGARYEQTVMRYEGDSWSFLPEIPGDQELVLRSMSASAECVVVAGHIENGDGSPQAWCGKYSIAEELWAEISIPGAEAIGSFSEVLTLDDGSMLLAGAAARGHGTLLHISSASEVVVEWSEEDASIESLGELPDGTLVAAGYIGDRRLYLERR